MTQLWSKILRYSILPISIVVTVKFVSIFFAPYLLHVPIYQQEFDDKLTLFQIYTNTLNDAQLINSFITSLIFIIIVTPAILFSYRYFISVKAKYDLGTLIKIAKNKEYMKAKQFQDAQLLKAFAWVTTVWILVLVTLFQYLQGFVFTHTMVLLIIIAMIPTYFLSTATYKQIQLVDVKLR